MTLRPVLVGAAAVAALVAVPTSASAASITLNQQCYARVPTKGGQPIVANLTGGLPGGRYQVYGVNGRAGSVVGNFDAAGNAQAVLASGVGSIGIAPSRGRTFQVAVKEFRPFNQPQVPDGVATAKATNVALDIARTPRAAFSARRVKVSGITAITGNRTMYASWYSGKRLVKRIKLGVASDQCGYVSVRRSMIPRTKNTKFRLRIHSQKRYSSKQYAISTTVRRFRTYR